MLSQGKEGGSLYTDVVSHSSEQLRTSRSVKTAGQLLFHQKGFYPERDRSLLLRSFEIQLGGKRYAVDDCRGRLRI